MLDLHVWKIAYETAFGFQNPQYETEFRLERGRMSGRKEPEFFHKATFAHTIQEGRGKVVRGAAWKVCKELT